MASLKIASLLLRTLSKPIANKIKQQAKEHEGFKGWTVQFAQWQHRAEMNLRVRLLGESPKHVRPLSEARAIDAGANFLSEGFLFAVAATIIVGETYRGRRAESKRRDKVADALALHDAQLEEVKARLEREREAREEAVKRERELEKIVEEIVLIGLHGGFGELPPDWQRHLRVGRLAREFGTTGRVVGEGEEGEEEGGEAAEGAVSQGEVKEAEGIVARIAAEEGKKAEERGAEEEDAKPIEPPAAAAAAAQS
ncbi:hypothetical protein JCM6882_006866 [Rhodosporidiobolus microsporus]